MAVELYYFEELDSTNAYARREFGTLPDGALVAAGSQSAGRGRLGRKWISAPGKGIYASLVMKRCRDPFLATMVISLGTLDLVRAVAPEVPVWLKWPNDLYVGARKLAGVLCETCLGPGNRLDGVIAGVGLNVNVSAEELARIDLPATSLSHEQKSPFFAKNLLSGLVEKLNRRYINMIDNPSELRREWREANALVGCEIELTDGDGVTTAWVAGVDDEGMLLLDAGEGRLRRVCAGDVRITRAGLERLVRR